MVMLSQAPLSFHCELSVLQSTQVLTESEDQRVCEVLGEIADKVVKRRIMMYQYFKDFDRVSKIYISIFW